MPVASAALRDSDRVEQAYLLGVPLKTLLLAGERGVLPWVCELVTTWFARHGQESTDCSWMVTELTRSLKNNAVDAFVAQLSTIEALPLTTHQGHYNLPASDHVYLLKASAHAPEGEQGFALRGTDLSELLALPTGFYVLWNTMTHFDHFLPSMMTFEVLRGCALQPDGDEAIEALARNLPALLAGGFLQQQLQLLLQQPLGARKITLAARYIGLFHEGLLLPAQYVQWCCDSYVGFRDLSQHVLTAARPARREQWRQAVAQMPAPK